MPSPATSTPVRMLRHRHGGRKKARTQLPNAPRSAQKARCKAFTNKPLAANTRSVKTRFTHCECAPYRTTSQHACEKLSLTQQISAARSSALAKTCSPHCANAAICCRTSALAKNLLPTAQMLRYAAEPGTTEASASAKSSQFPPLTHRAAGGSSRLKTAEGAVAKGQPAEKVFQGRIL